MVDQQELRQRMQAYAAARRPLAEWIAGAQALALLHGALQCGLLDGARTPRTAEVIATETGIAPERAANLCGALEAHGILAREGDEYRLTDAFALQSSSDALLPLSGDAQRPLALADRPQAVRALRTAPPR